MPPGDGTTVSREGALAALVRGQDDEVAARRRPAAGKPTDRARLDSRRGGHDLRLAAAAGDARERPRYPVAIVGGGYRGILESLLDADRRARLDRGHRADGGRARRGEEPRIGSTAGTPADLRDARPDAPPAAVAPATRPSPILAFAAIALSLLGARALVAAPRAARACSRRRSRFTFAIVLSGFDVTRPALLLPALAVLTVARERRGGALLADAALAVGFIALDRRLPRRARRRSRRGRRSPRSGRTRARAAASTDRRTSRRRSSSRSRCSPRAVLGLRGS